jgi:hypothetical protein
MRKDGQTDRNDEANSHFSRLANAPKTYDCILGHWGQHILREDRFTELKTIPGSKLDNKNSMYVQWMEEGTS